MVAEFVHLPRRLDESVPGQRARLRLKGFPWAQYGTIAGHVLTTGEEIRDGHVRVECDVDAVNKSFIPAQHGLAGALEIEIERLSPAALVLRLAGEWIPGPVRRRSRHHE